MFIGWWPGGGGRFARSNPLGFSAYCTISNTVKAVGIGGTASIYLSAKITPFLTQSREAMARNIVALTRSKGLCVLLLPSTQEFRFSFLHTLRTLCACRHGLYHIGSAPPDLERLASFLSLPDATFNSEPRTFSGSSPTRLLALARGIFSHSPCNSLMRGKLTFSPCVSAPTFHSQIIGNCQQGISTGRNSVILRLGNPLWNSSERAVKKERTPATVRTVSRDVRSMWAF